MGYQIAPGELRSSERLGQEAQDRCPSKAGTVPRRDRSSSRRDNRRIVELCHCFRNTEDERKDKQDGLSIDRNRLRPRLRKWGFGGPGVSGSRGSGEISGERVSCESCGFWISGIPKAIMGEANHTSCVRLPGGSKPRGRGPSGGHGRIQGPASPVAFIY